MRHWLTAFWRAVTRRQRFECDMSDEMALHLELHEQSLIDAGVAPSKARRRARAEFGSTAAAMDGCRDSRASAPVEGLFRDLRIAVRRLWAAPGLLATAVCTLALGLGANTLVFAALHGLLIKPLPFAEGDRLAWIVSRPSATPDQDEQVSADDVKAIAARARLFESLAVIGDANLIREQPERFERWHGLAVTRTLFEVLRVSPAAGAVPSDAQLSASVKPMLVSHERWQRDFARDPSLVGRTLVFADNKRFVVTGVLPPRLPFPFLRSPVSGGNGSGYEPGVQDFWIITMGGGDDLPGGVVISRMRSAATLKQVRTELDAVVASPAPGTDADQRTVVAVPLRDHALGVLKPALPLLQAFAVLVFLIACANLANLQLARASAQQTDRAVRLALGATRHHLRRLAMAESIVIALLGGLAALGLLAAGLGPLVRFPGGPQPAGLVTVDAAPLCLLAILCVTAATVCGFAPSIARAKSPLASLLGDAPRGTPPRALHGLRTLVTIQVALSLVLLAGAGALRVSLQRLIGVETGYDSRHVLTADVLLYVPKAHLALRQVYGRVRAIPGIEALGVIHSTPLTGKWQIRDGIEIVEAGARRTTPPMTGGFVAFDYFQAMGIDLVEGRYFSEAEAFEARPRAVILNDLAAKAYFPGRSAVGGQLFMYGTHREVVGVVRAIRDVGLDVPAEPQFYQPAIFNGSQIAMRVKGDPEQYVDVVRRTLESADPRLIVNNVRPLDSIIDERVGDRRAAAQMVTMFGALALALAAVGLAGVLHFNATRRSRELGLRSALGATRGDLVQLVTREALTMFVPGVIAGGVLIAATGGLVRSILFNTSVFEPVTLALVTAMLVVAGALATLIPAWRAARVDPLVALRR
jgi:predicted permease